MIFTTSLALIRCIPCMATPEFQVPVKTSTIHPVFPDYLSISYSYGNKVDQGFPAYI